MAKKSNKSKGLRSKRQKSSGALPPVSSLPVVEDIQRVEEQPAAVPELSLKTWIGVIDTELYDRLLKPAFMSFGLRRDDEPLRQLVESIVTAIAMSDAYEGCRKIDDICQRYLYYLESLEGVQRRSWEAVELNGLTDYWRSQVVLTLIRDSSAIFGLLLPESQATVLPSASLGQQAFLDSIKALLSGTLDGRSVTSREMASERDLYDFAHGMSFPWLGFLPESVFSLQHTVHDADILTNHAFAIASAEQTKVFCTAMGQAVKETLFIDLIAAQHKKIYEELCLAFEPSERLPEDFKGVLEQRVKFDKTYQAAYDAIWNGIPLTKPLHRASKLDIEALNIFGQFIAVVRKAAELNLGIYLFHYVG